MTTVVRPAESSVRAAWIFASVSLSSEAVASSSRRIGGFIRNALAMAKRCFCPPERRIPFSPISLS